jgi:hypothetical protein
MERTAEEWGRIAVSVPGWPWMPGMRSEINTDTRRAAYRWLAGPSDDRHYGHVVIVEDKHGHACRTLATLQPGPDDVPDVDDPATAGSMLELLGDGYSVAISIDGWVSIGSWPTVIAEASTLGRACIAAAEALGRWPGGAA